ncbi:MAG: DUF599 family protein [Candidatus Lokiarchaeota archaeon]|nr:DUF599 family protein [Candidatus Lokiarchaeota archaeon]
MFLLNELALITLSAGILIYIALLFYSTKRRKMSRRNALGRIYKNWVHVRLQDNTPYNAIQAIRNVMMADSTFISALLILIGILVGLNSANFLDQSLFFGIPGITWGFIQFICNMFVSIFCLFSFILSIRMFARLSLLISGDPLNSSYTAQQGEELTNEAFISAQNHWMQGVRALMYLGSTLSWLVHPILSICVSIIVTVYLIRFQDIWVFKI